MSVYTAARRPWGPRFSYNNKQVKKCEAPTPRAHAPGAAALVAAAVRLSGLQSGVDRRAGRNLQVSQTPAARQVVPEVTERAPSVASAWREGLPFRSLPPGTSVTLHSAGHGSRGAAEEPGVSDVGASRAISPFGISQAELTITWLALCVTLSPC